jgi:NADH-quinone oxidoreductase subunit L
MVSVFSQYAWLIPLFPLLAFVLITAIGRQARGFAVFAGIAGTAISFVLSVLVMAERLGGAEDYTWNDWTWLSAGGKQFTFGFEINELNAIMLLVVSFVSLLVNIYSRGYMADDERISVFFGYVALFTFSMLGLVISSNLVQLYIFWELVGLCSFLLVGFWYHKPEAKAAAKKAFIVTRIGDVGLFIAMLLLFWHMPGSSLEFSQIHNAFAAGEIAGGVATAIAILIFIGAVGKSGQFPLHTWLPDAMEGPTPISALIHAATMVAAGVYLVARTYDVFLASPAALETVAWTGAFTAIFAATIAIAQNDIKRVLAYSTISQLGYMMMALGIGTMAAYQAGIYHLFTHAFFKALLFLGAGSVIHAVHTQNIQEMGGVGKKMKTTMWTFAAGFLALAGIVPFAGFWSKDAILAEALHHHPVLFVIGLITAVLTAFYMSRLFFLVFTGKPRSDYSAHESPAVMTVPMIILAILSVIAGFVYLPLTGESLHLDAVTMILSTVAGLAGIGIGYLFYVKGTWSAQAVAERFPGVHRVLANKYYIDELYQAVFVNGLRGLGAVLHAIDMFVIGGLVKLAAAGSLGLGRLGRRLQNGQLQTYGLVTLLGLVILIAVIAGRRYF